MSSLIPFTFNLPVTGLSNPFLLQQQKQRQQQLQQQREKKPRLPPRPAPPEDTFSPSVLKKRRRSVSPMPIVAPSPRSRGWTPTMGEPSCTTTTTTGGYQGASLNYEEMREAGWENAQYGREEQDIIEELPPAKRRRTFAGSIVSTAISAALIGTAVGITVYRLWRDRGKKRNELQLEEPHHMMMPPPPPYQEKEDSPLTTAVPTTTTAAVTPALEQEPQAKVTPATPRSVRRGRHAHTSSISKRTAIERQRRSVRQRQQAANAFASPPLSISPGRSSFSLSQDFDAEMDDEEGDADQMDWIGDKVSSLLEEAKKALGREIVVMSDAKEDEVDDGSGAWVEDDDDMVPSTSASAGPSRSRPGSIKRRHRSRDIAVHASPSMAAHNSQVSPKSFGAAASVESLRMPQTLAPAKEDPSSWESPELRELMERARAKYLANRS